MFGQAMMIDDGWFRSVTSFAQNTAWLHTPMDVLTTLSVIVLGLMAIAVWWSARARADRRTLAALMWLGLGTGIAVVASYALKEIFQEQRPCRAMHVVVVQQCPGVADYSFPSNHTTLAVAIAAGIWLANRRWGYLAVAVAVLEGFSRVYLGQHYPHDVLAGFVLAGLVVVGGWPWVRGQLERLVTTLESTPLRPILVARHTG